MPRAPPGARLLTLWLFLRRPRTQRRRRHERAGACAAARWLAGYVAERHGITRFVAEVLPENRAMLDVFRDGFDAHVACREGVDRVEFPTGAWRTASKRFSRAAPSG